MTTISQLIAFLFVGGINTLFGFSIYSLGIFLGLHYIVATFVATFFGVLFNFKTIGTYVFKNKNNKLILKFISVYVFLYFLNVLLIKLMQPITHNLYLSGFVATVLGAMISFVMNKYFVFRVAHETN